MPVPGKRGSWSASICLFLLFSVSARTAFAQESGTGDLEAAIAKCRTIESPEGRLSCYDRVTRTSAAGAKAPDARAPDPATEHGSVVTPSAPAAAERPAAAIAVPRRPQEIIEKKSPAPARENRFSVSVLKSGTDELGRLLFFLDNKELWRQVSYESLSSGARFPRNAEIRKERLGSYTIKLDGYSARIPISFVRNY